MLIELVLVAFARSRRVVRISGCTRSVLLKGVRCDLANVSVIHCPIFLVFQPQAQSWNAERPRVLQIETNPYKYIECVAEALAGIACCLAIVGPMFQTQVTVLERYRTKYETTVGLLGAKLVEQYSRSNMLLFVSPYEGFGFPIVETNAVDRQIVTCKLSLMRKEAKVAAFLMDLFREEDIRAGVVKVIGDPNHRERLIGSGLAVATRFRLVTIAGQYAVMYGEVSGQMSENQGQTNAGKI